MAKDDKSVDAKIVLDCRYLVKLMKDVEVIVHDPSCSEEVREAASTIRDKFVASVGEFKKEANELSLFC